MTAEAPDDGDRVLTEGERWAREQLALMLDARFTPAAVVRFFLASFRRSADVRAARPDLARTAWSWAGIGALAWVVLAAAGVQPFRRRLRDGLLWWAACTVMLDWHLGMFETDDGEPRPLGSADALTLTRAWLVPVALDFPHPFVCAAGAATDVLDGVMARRAQPTRAGRDLEGLVDTCFSAAALRAARRHDLIPAIAVRAELGRLGIGFGYALYVYFGRAQAPDPRLTRAARLTTPVRAAGVIAAGAGQRRLAGALVSAGAVVSVGVLALASRRRA